MSPRMVLISVAAGVVLGIIAVIHQATTPPLPRFYVAHGPGWVNSLAWSHVDSQGNATGVFTSYRIGRHARAETVTVTSTLVTLEVKGSTVFIVGGSSTGADIAAVYANRALAFSVPPGDNGIEAQASTFSVSNPDTLNRELVRLRAQARAGYHVPGLRYSSSTQDISN